MVGRDAIGRVFGPYHGTVDRNRLRYFAQVTGETRPEYLDAEVARAAGWRDIPAPPTYTFCLQMLDTIEPLDWAVAIGVDMPRALHGDQLFTYHQPICAGDRLSFILTIVDVFEKKGGALTFIVTRTSARDHSDQLVAELDQTLVVRNR